MARIPGRDVLRRVGDWTDHVFFAAWEVSVLAIPTLLLLLGVDNQEAVSLSAMTAFVVSAAAVATFRGGFVGSESWPRPGHLPTLPVRSAYYSFVLGGATFLGVEVQLLWGSLWFGIVVPTFACAAALAFLPRVLRGLRTVSRVSI